MYQTSFQKSNSHKASEKSEKENLNLVKNKWMKKMKEKRTDEVRKTSLESTSTASNIWKKKLKDKKDSAAEREQEKKFIKQKSRSFDSEIAGGESGTEKVAREPDWSEDTTQSCLGTPSR